MIEISLSLLVLIIVLAMLIRVLGVSLLASHIIRAR